MEFKIQKLKFMNEKEGKLPNYKIKFTKFYKNYCIITDFIEVQPSIKILLVQNRQE